MVAEALEKMGFSCYVHRRVPCNDGGISLGQAVVAARRFAAAGGETAAKESSDLMMRGRGSYA
jgi:hydrogenase maturation protein HypF